MKVDPIVYFNTLNNVFIIPNNGHFYSVDNFRRVNEEHFAFKYYQTSMDTLLGIINATFLKNFKKPFMVIADSFGIPQFSNIIIPNEIIDILNRDGLHIFINEPLVKYLGERQYLDKTNLSQDTLKKLKLSNARFETTNLDKQILRSFPLDCIQDLIENNNLKNVSVYTPDYNARKFFTNTYPKIQLHCQDLFLAEWIQIINNLPDNTKTEIKFKFLSANWRYAQHRYLIMSYLIHYSGKYSWHYRGTFEKLNQSIWFDLNEWPQEITKKIKSGIEILNQSVPLNLDFEVTDPVTIDGNLSDLLILPTYDKKPYFVSKELYDNIFCAVINECDFPDPTSNISEKTLLCIKYKKPFVLAGQPGSLDYARKLGFKTFNEFWNEDYDSETNHEKRFLKIFETLDYINSLSFEQLEDIYERMIPIIEHNYNNLKKLAESKIWPLF